MKAASVNHMPVRDRIICTVKEACSALSLGRSKFYELVKAGEIETVKIGSRTLVKVASLLRVVEGHSLSTNQPTTKARIGTDARQTATDDRAAKAHKVLRKPRPSPSVHVR